MSSKRQTEIQNQFITEIERHKGLVYKVVQAYCKNADDQKDLFQEILFQLWRSYENYNQKYKLSTWMYRIALNVAISNYRKNLVKNKHLLSRDFIAIHPYEELDTGPSEEVQLLRQFVQDQKKLDKGILLLYLDGKTHEEIAEIIGISKSNVGTKISRLKKRLKQHITNHLN